MNSSTIFDEGVSGLEYHGPVVYRDGKVDMVRLPGCGVIADLGINAAAQPFKFGGKELVTNNGLNEYDFGARQYYPAVPHFTSVCPLYRHKRRKENPRRIILPCQQTGQQMEQGSGEE